MTVLRTLLSAIAAVALCAPAGAQDEPARADERRAAPMLLERNRGFEAPQFQEGREVPVIPMAWQDRDPEAVIEDVSAAVAIMLDGRTPERLNAALKEVLFGNDAGSWSRIPAAPQLLVRYDREFDEFRLINEELDAIREALGRIGVEEAVERAEQVVSQLIERGVIDRSLYQDAAIQLGYRRVGSGRAQGRPDRGRIVEYRVTYRPRIEGIELANAGVRVGVLANGDIAAMRVGGVTPEVKLVDGQVEAEDDVQRREVEMSPGMLMTRFYRTLGPNAAPEIAWSRVMYAMPEGEKRAVLEPLLVVSFSETYVTDEGERVSSRRRILGLSLVDPEARPIDFTAPARDAAQEPIRPE